MLEPKDAGRPLVAMQNFCLASVAGAGDFLGFWVLGGFLEISVLGGLFETRGFGWISVLVVEIGGEIRLGAGRILCPSLNQMSAEVRKPAEFKHIIKGRKRN